MGDHDRSTCLNFEYKVYLNMFLHRNQNIFLKFNNVKIKCCASCVFSSSQTVDGIVQQHSWRFISG